MNKRAESVKVARPANQPERGGSIPASALQDSIPEVERHDGMFAAEESDFIFPVSGSKRTACESIIIRDHYTHTIPSGKSHVFYWKGVIAIFSIPANKNLGRFVLKRECVCWELSRLWAIEQHRRCALTEAISIAIVGLKKVEPSVVVLVSYADPNVGHEGFVYKAASWIYTGKSEDPRGYQDANGKILPRRAFHSGTGKGMTKAQIEAKGFREIIRDGKHRFVFGLTKPVKREIRRIWQSAS